MSVRSSQLGAPSVIPFPEPRLPPGPPPGASAPDMPALPRSVSEKQRFAQHLNPQELHTPPSAQPPAANPQPTPASPSLPIPLRGGSEKQRVEQHYRAQEVPAPPQFSCSLEEEQRIRGAPPIPPTYHAATSPVASNSTQRPASGNPLLPTALRKLDYGSNFIPHSYTIITCSLPLEDGMTLLGTAQGIMVLIDGPDGGTRHIWNGLPVWDMKLIRIDRSKVEAPRGSVLFHCAGIEDGTSGRPKRDAEARVWKLEVLIALAKWARQQTDYDGLDLAVSRKGKARAFSLRGGFSNRSLPSNRQPSASRLGEDLAMAWAGEFTSLPGEATNVMSIATFLQPHELNIALSTPNSIIVHTGSQTSTGSYAFTPPKTFYIPFTPTSFAFVELEIQGSLPDTRLDNSSSLFEWDDAESIMDIGEAVIGRTLGLFVTFSGARGCVIRTADSGVVELKKGGRGDWLGLQKVGGGVEEVYAFTRGSETFIFPVGRPLLIQHRLR